MSEYRPPDPGHPPAPWSDQPAGHGATAAGSRAGPAQAPPGYVPPPPGYAPPGYAPPPGWYVPPQPPGPAPGVWFAPHGDRLVAYILDTLVLFAIMFGALIVLVPVAFAARGAGGAAMLLLFLVFIVVTIGYFPFFWARGGQTPGMKPFRLYVVRDLDGGPVSGGQAFLRLLGYWVNGVAFYIGFIWVFVDDRRRGWHDLIAGTLVIKR